MALAVFAAIFIGASVILLIVRKLAFGYLARWAKKTHTKADDILLGSIKSPTIYWTLAIGLYIALDTSGFPKKYVSYGLNALYVLIILSVTLAVANISSSLFLNAMKKTGTAVPVTGLSKTVIKALIFAMGFLIILNGLGISITPILTALGVGGLAVALALQDTLSNLFAGMHIIVENTVRVGDYIKLSSGEEGYVRDIGWRTTRVRQLSNNVIIIPNSKLVQSNITNYHLPEKRMSLNITIGVSYDSDPDTIERILVEEALGAADHTPGLLKDPPPVVRLIPGFGESSLDFTLTCHVEEYTDQYRAQHEIRKRLFKRFKKEGIEIPFPIRTVHLKR
ncbi:MAG: mechanosensitive ion channel family protein [Deltaproteobacteria bacterium]|nr:mechanosensitive ion channel family protein [Deltaproteobacteria bacterium]